MADKKKRSPNARPAHGIVTLTVGQLSSREKTALAMHLQGFGENIIAEALHAAPTTITSWIESGIQENE